MRLTHGVTFHLCADHASPEFQAQNSGRDFVLTLTRIWQGDGCLTSARSRALSLFLQRAQSRGRERLRERPGSYCWKALRNEVEHRAAAGEPVRTILADLRARHAHDVADVPSERTIRRWYHERRWEDGDYRTPLRPGFARRDVAHAARAQRDRRAIVRLRETHASEAAARASAPPPPPRPATPGSAAPPRPSSDRAPSRRPRAPLGPAAERTPALPTEAASVAAAPPTHRPAARRALRHYVLAAFRTLQEDVEAGQEVPFALDGAGRAGGPALYNWRPLFGAYVAERAERLTALPDMKAALEALRSEPALVALARERAGAGADLDAALRETLLLPLVVAAADAGGGFDLDDPSLERLLQHLERTAVADRTTYAALAPLVGVEAGGDGVELGCGVVLQRLDPAALAADWPECQGLLPDGFLRESDRRHALVVSAAVPRGPEAALPDAAAAFAAVVTAMRLVLGGGIAAGPAAFERLDWAPRAVLALPPAASVIPPGPSVRLDQHAATLVRALAPRIAATGGPGGAPLAIALGRYGVARSAVTAAERVEGLHAALEPLLGEDGAGPWAIAMRAAALVGRTAAERQRLVGTLRQASRVTRGTTWPSALDEEDRLDGVVDGVVRTVLVAALEADGAPSAFAELLDGVLLGARPRPQVVDGVARIA